MSKIELSVVVPVFNESENVTGLVDEIAVALEDVTHEMIFVNDASTDDTETVLKALKDSYPALRVVSHRQNAGQSRAIRTGILAAWSDYIATLDGDGQNDPADIPLLFASITRADKPDNLGLVGGQRAKRKDGWAKRMGSRIGNNVRKWLLRDNTDDTGCGLKVFRRDAFLCLPYFDHFHRYIPALMLREGYVTEFMDVNHRERAHGVSKYTNFGRFMVSLSDLRGVMWLSRRARKPNGWYEV